MQRIVTTRLSLLLRIRNAQDTEAWTDFVSIYAPLIFRYAQRMGLQEADAADVTQDVLRVVAESIETFDYDPSVGRFRGWLKKVAFFTYSRLQQKKGRQPVGAADSQINGLLEQQASENDARFWDDQYSRRIYKLAAERVRPTVRPATWSAFVATEIDGEDPQSVARRLQMNTGSIYVARNRVYAKLKQALSELDER